jgi:IS1 family transposase
VCTRALEKPKPDGAVVIVELDAMWHDVQKTAQTPALDAVTDRRLDGECGRRDTATVTKTVERLAPWNVAIYIDGAA